MVEGYAVARQRRGGQEDPVATTASQPARFLAAATDAVQAVPRDPSGPHPRPSGPAAGGVAALGSADAQGAWRPRNAEPAHGLPHAAARRAPDRPGGRR